MSQKSNKLKPKLVNLDGLESSEVKLPVLHVDPIRPLHRRKKRALRSFKDVVKRKRILIKFLSVNAPPTPPQRKIDVKDLETVLTITDRIKIIEDRQNITLKRIKSNAAQNRVTRNITDRVEEKVGIVHIVPSELVKYDDKINRRNAKKENTTLKRIKSNAAQIRDTRNITDRVEERVGIVHIAPSKLVIYDDKMNRRNAKKDHHTRLPKLDAAWRNKMVLNQNRKQESKSLFDGRRLQSNLPTDSVQLPKIQTDNHDVSTNTKKTKMNMPAGIITHGKPKGQEARTLADNHRDTKPSENQRNYPTSIISKKKAGGRKDVMEDKAAKRSERISSDVTTSSILHQSGQSYGEERNNTDSQSWQNTQGEVDLNDKSSNSKQMERRITKTQIHKHRRPLQAYGRKDDVVQMVRLQPLTDPRFARLQQTLVKPEESKTLVKQPRITSFYPWLPR